jgi:predicted ATPase
MEIVDRGRVGATPLAHASFGTIRALALLAMLYDPAPPLLTCVEEIDHGLHPHVFDRLVELLRQAAARSQLIIATHSPALVNRLRPAELIVCERDLDTGLARIPAVDPQAVAQTHAASGYGLGELWFSGALGGVPRG